MENEKSPKPLELPAGRDSSVAKSYEEIKEEMAACRKKFSVKYSSLHSLYTKEATEELTNYWINSISNELYSKWQNTPWDFNGTTTQPQQGSIACGYFVTTILQDMGVKLNRVKLSTCASSEMMKSLTPRQPIRNLSSLTYTAFNDKLKEDGKGVYVIGLDFHTGFIVNDGAENWFIHSNYIERKGVTKEPVINSGALKSSKTRWLVSLTGDTSFLQRWLRD